jgi:hypothetical protein
MCSIWFKDTITSPEQTILSGIVNAHDGISNDTIPQSVIITEESISTGGNFSSRSVKITSPASSSNTVHVCWPFPITALVVKFTTIDTQVNDLLDMSIGANTIVGIITANVSTLAPSWTSSAYLVGNKVTYNNPEHGSLVYTCIKDTVSNEIPSNISFWRQGFQINVSSTVLENSMIGYYMSITNGVNLDNVGRIIYKNHNSIFVENAPLNTYLASSPTYVRQTVYSFKDYEIGYPEAHTIGSSKIGGSYIPANTTITVKYTNNYTSEQTLMGSVEYLY